MSTNFWLAIFIFVFVLTIIYGMKLIEKIQEDIRRDERILQGLKSVTQEPYELEPFDPLDNADADVAVPRNLFTKRPLKN